MSTPGLFDPFEIRGVRFPNRIVVSPMCMYSASADGMPSPWHLIHLGSRAVGGAGAVFVEATAISAPGRITDGDVGLWNQEQADALASIASFVSSVGSVPAIQLSHAGRKGGRTVPWAGYRPIAREEWGPLHAPSAIPFREDWDVPEAMTEADMQDLVDEFVASAQRAVSAGFQVVELHFAHGYLVHQFLSPLSNHREDDYGGSLQNRLRLPVAIVRAVRDAMPDGTALFVRLSVVDWIEGGLTIDDSVHISRELGRAGADLIDCSSGAIVPGEKVPVAPGYHVGFSSRIRTEAGVATSAVGVIVEPLEANEIIADSAADLVFIGRGFLRDAYWARRAAVELGVENELPIPLPYRRAVERMNRMSQW